MHLFRALFKRTIWALFKRTIWAPGAIPLLEAKYAVPLKQFALPIYDLLMIGAGIYAVKSGIPAIDEIVPGVVADIIGYAFALTALVCLVGVSFPALWRVEIAAKIALSTLLGLYFLALLILSGGGDSNRNFVAWLVLALLVLPYYRLWGLGTEIRDRKGA